MTKKCFLLILAIPIIFMFNGCAAWNYKDYAKAQVEISKEQRLLKAAKYEAMGEYWKAQAAGSNSIKITGADGKTQISIPQNDPAALVMGVAEVAEGKGNMPNLEAPKPSPIEQGIANAIPMAVVGYFLNDTMKAAVNSKGSTTTISQTNSGSNSTGALNNQGGTNTVSPNNSTTTSTDDHSGVAEATP